MSPRLGILALTLSLVSASAFASPLLPERAMTSAAQRSLAADVRAERAAHPERFTRVQNLVSLRRRVYRASRAQRPSVVRELRALGPDALFPLLDVLAVSGPSPTLSADERAVLTLGALDALATLRDARAEPVLRAAFERTDDPDTLRAAARALGAVNTDSAVAMLTTAARTAGIRQPAALEGLGVTRRRDAALTLASVLDDARDDATVTAAARGLAEAGSTWAMASSGRTAALPVACHTSLVHALVRGVAAPDVQRALAAVATDETLRQLDAARASADAAAQARIATATRIVRRSLGAH